MTDSRAPRWLPRALNVATVCVVFGWVVVTAWAMSRHPFGGHADQSNALVVARNLAEGRGYTIDLVFTYFWYQPLQHPAGTWPLAYPTLVSLSMMVFGDGPVGWRMPNVLLAACGCLLVRCAMLRMAPRMRGRTVWANLTALGFLAYGPYHTVALLSDGMLVVLYLGLVIATTMMTFEASTRRALVVGVVGGLFLLAKPGLVVSLAAVVVAGAAMTWNQRKRNKTPRPARKTLSTFGLATAVAFACVAPYLARYISHVGGLLQGEHVLCRIPHRYGSLPSGGGVISWEEAYAVRFDRPFTMAEVIDRYGGVERWLHVELDGISAWLGALFTSPEGVAPLVAVALVVLALRLRAVAKDSFAIRLALINSVAFVVQALFVILYYHYEPRYLWPYWTPAYVATAALIPSLLRALERPISRLLLCVALIGVADWALLPQYRVQYRDAVAEPLPIPEEIRWLSQNTQPDDVVMTRLPWQTTFHSGRRSAMTPAGGTEAAIEIARLYAVDYLVVARDGHRPDLYRAAGEGQDPRFRVVYRGDAAIIARLHLDATP